VAPDVSSETVVAPQPLGVPPGSNAQATVTALLYHPPLQPPPLQLADGKFRPIPSPGNAATATAATSPTRRIRAFMRAAPCPGPRRRARGCRRLRRRGAARRRRAAGRSLPVVGGRPRASRPAARAGTRRAAP